MATYKPKDYSRYLGFKQEHGWLTVEGLLGKRKRGCATMEFCVARCKCGRTVERPLTKVIHEHLLSCGQCGLRATTKVYNRKDHRYPNQPDRLKWSCPFIADMCVKSEALRICCLECSSYSVCGNKCLNTPKQCGAKRRKNEQ